MVIPWGDGKGQLSYKEKQRKIHEPEPDTPEWALKKNSTFFSETETVRSGPVFLNVDDAGNIYIYEYADKQVALKVFDSVSNEIANLTDNPPREFFIQQDKIVATNRGAHEVTYLSRKDFSILKKFEIPKNYDLSYSKTLNGFIEISHPFESKPKEMFVFDEIEKAHHLDENNKRLEIFSDGNHVGLKMGGSEILNLSLLFEKWKAEEMFNWGPVVQDKYGDFYLVWTSEKEHFQEKKGIKGIYERTLFKFNKSGELLFSMKSRLDPFMHVHSIVVDVNGNIYNSWADENGFHIDRYGYLNDKEKK